jgi:hypothetical protein
MTRITPRLKNRGAKTVENPRLMPSIDDQILGQLAAYDPIPMDAWDTFEFLFRRGLFKQQDLSICLFRYTQALTELKEKDLIRLATVTASERRWLLTDKGRKHINTILGQDGVNIKQLQDSVQDRLEEMLKQMDVAGRLARA